MEHLQSTCAIDPHHVVLVLRHAGNQQWKQLIDNALALFRPVEDCQRRQVALEPDQGFPGLRQS
ncbi:hypothetical protein D3C76_1498560 [compost metagenome]